ncbi:carbohydrate-binding protein [Cystobacter fuscus]|uniref:rhamnogalacturonan lyase family protein n=1 Tax=Cystobacter fuscus TaxID=43 RepID=UPI002B29634D|nr:carbohydrate-binding protein [Cystobacter fuscus]
MIPKKLLVCLAALTLMPVASHAQRKMEKLDRGVVALRNSATATWVSWRVLGLDTASTTYNLYRSTNGGAAVKVNSTPLTVSNYTDTSAPTASAHTYYVRPVVGGVEQAPSIPYTLPANGSLEMAYRIPIRGLPNHSVGFVWVGDLDGDGEYDYVLDRRPSLATDTQKLEAYTRTGIPLWVIDLGPGSLDRDNIEPGPSVVDVGHWDGVTVYDLDGDGRAEVILRSADGVVFGNGTTLSGLGTNAQAISVINGLTGAERARAVIPKDYIADGPMAAHLGIGYLNGTTPSIVAKLKNRVGSGGFNLMVLAYDFAANNSLTQKWKWLRTGALSDFHQFRIFDVDGNGTDEVCDGGYVLNGDGTLRYKVGLDNPNVIHGDRFHIGDLNPSRPGLEGFAIQQDNPNKLLYLVYDAATGATIRPHYGENVEDTARGVVADIDPSTPGMEYWSFHGYHRIDTGAVVNATTPYPNFRIWWDGDVLSETLNDGKVEKWDAANSGLSRLFTVGSSTSSGVAGRTGDRGAPFFYGDIIGDWREEIISTNADNTQLIICHTKTPTSTRLYTLAHNPAYRMAMTVKGYMQSPQPDYFLGNGMSTPPSPNISYVPLVLQSELNTTVGGGASIADNRAGYTGSGFADFNTTGGYVEWTRVNGAGGGATPRTLRFRFSNGSGTSRTGQLTVNGVSQSITFPATGGWTSWSTLDVNVGLNAGATNTVRLQANGQGLANIDYLTVP